MSGLTHLQEVAYLLVMAEGRAFFQVDAQRIFGALESIELYLGADGLPIIVKGVDVVGVGEDSLV